MQAAHAHGQYARMSSARSYAENESVNASDDHMHAVDTQGLSLLAPAGAGSLPPTTPALSHTELTPTGCGKTVKEGDAVKQLGVDSVSVHLLHQETAESDSADPLHVHA